MRAAILLSMAASILVALAPAAAQTTLEIWQGVPPGSEKWQHSEITYTETIPPRKGESSPQFVTMVRDVVKPTLTAYFPDPATASDAAIIICPGGGLRFLGWFEATRAAQWFAAHGVTAFALKYRVVPTSAEPVQFERETADFLRAFSRVVAHAARPTTFDAIFPDAKSRQIHRLAEADARQAVKFVRSHAVGWKISPDRIGMLGFSAGAFLVTDVIFANDSATKLDFAVLISGGESHHAIPFTPPPLFIAVAQDDRWMSELDKELFERWDRAGWQVELHYFETGGHGFEIDPSNPWMHLLEQWLKRRDLIGKVDD